MVRLKQARELRAAVTGTGFQFHNGSIKAFWELTLQGNQIGFNSTMVRLKQSLWV